MIEIPEITLESDETISMKFNDIPLWAGVQKNPGVHKSFPFELSAGNGPIMQSTASEVIDEVIKAYHTDEYKFITQPPGSSEWANAIGDTKVKSVEQMLGNTNHSMNVLEIGAGGTWVASKLQEKYNVNSYVIIDPTVHDSTDKIEVIREYFPHPKLNGRLFDLILGFSVLEHVPDPILFLENIKKYLSNNGKVLLVYPDCEDALSRGDINVLIHEHLSYFTKSSSQWLASKCGFKINTIISNNDCFTVELQIDSEVHSQVPKLNEMELLNNSVNKFRSLFSNVKNKIALSLEQGKSVGFHGATNGLNTFLHMSGLGDNSNIFIYDGDDLKQGLYLPSCSSKIMSPSDKSYSEHDLMVISAMSFFDGISDFAINSAGFSKEKILPLIGI